MLLLFVFFAFFFRFSFFFFFSSEIPLINANSVDPDQTPRSAASDMGLYFGVWFKNIYSVVDNNIQKHIRQQKQDLTISDEAYFNGLHILRFPN